jgi:hypothetical protein
VQGVRVRKRIDLHQGPVQREVLDLLDRKLVNGSGALAELIPEHVHQDALQPPGACLVLLHRPERPVRPDKGLLHEVLRTIPNEPAGQRVEGRQFPDGHALERFLGPALDPDVRHPVGPFHWRAHPLKTLGWPTLLHRQERAIGVGARTSVMGERRYGT